MADPAIVLKKSIKYSKLIDMHERRQQGFTLIELSIVLVIIGLIAGGILVGRDLIHAAELRATISQIEEYNTSVNTFRNKYKYLPGDIPPNAAAALGFFAETTFGGTAGHQDGNGLIEGGAAGFTGGLGETLSFWRHLTDAQMIDGNFGTLAIGNPLDPASGGVFTPLGSNIAPISQIFPPAKIGRGNYMTVYAATGLNYFQITGMSSMNSGGGFVLTNALTPIESQNMDAKTDDGSPMIGNVRAMSDAAWLNTAAALGSPCVTAAGRYDIGSVNGSELNCQLRLRGAF